MVQNLHSPGRISFYKRHETFQMFQLFLDFKTCLSTNCGNEPLCELFKAETIISTMYVLTLANPSFPLFGLGATVPEHCLETE